MSLIVDAAEWNRSTETSVLSDLGVMQKGMGGWGFLVVFRVVGGWFGDVFVVLKG